MPSSRIKLPLPWVSALALATPALSASFPGDRWETLSDAEAAAAGWSRAKLTEARAFSETLNTEAVMLVTRGGILDAWGPVDRKFNVHSIRKSLLSALCGIEVANGRLQLEWTLEELGIDDNEPFLSDIEKRATVHDLMKARSGIYHPALYETATMKARRPERHSHEPGVFWYYNNWDFNAMGTIYERVTGARIHEAFLRHIAARIGMQDYTAEDGSYVTGADSIHPAYPFRMSARDLARFGLLYLRGGQWRGESIVPADWVRDSLVSYSGAGDRGGYGYYWWTSRQGVHFPGVTLPEGSYSARGSGGHYIVVIPALDLVIVHRVDTDRKGRRVEAAEFGELLRRLLGAYESPLADTPPEQCLDTLLPLLMSKHRVPGAAVIGIGQGRIEWEKYVGLRSADAGEAVDAGTIFEAASMTKPLAAYAALKLVEQGRLDLDRPLASYLPEPYLRDEPLHEKITARMVLGHTAGLPNWRRGEPLRVKHEPGTRYLYSGEGFVFLQRVIEHLTGTDYDTHLRLSLLEPLGMTRSRHVWLDAWKTNAAAGHDDAGRVKSGRRFYLKPNAAYTLYTTPRDYAAFVIEMMHGERDAPHSLSAGSVRLMLTPQSPPTGRTPLLRRDRPFPGEIRFGLGWGIETTASGSRIRHGGTNGTGFRCYCEFDPANGHGVVIMTNGSSGGGLWKDVMRHIGVP